MHLNKVSIEDLPLRGKRVIIRADFNVPLDESGHITDDTRIRGTLPTINYAVDEGARVILCSHLGRPKGKVDPRLSLAPVARRLQRLLGKEVLFAEDCIGAQAEMLVNKMKPGDVLLLENLRFRGVEHLGNDGNKVLFGGEFEIPFMKSLGLEGGPSRVEGEMLAFSKKSSAFAVGRGVKFYLPVDCVVAIRPSPGEETKIVTSQEIPKGWYGLDIGPASVKLFTEALGNAKTILWNGPMGLFENDAYARGTMAVAHAVADAYALTIVGGADTALAVHKAGVSESMSFISTGGGAALELLEGKALPGIAALPNKPT